MTVLCQCSHVGLCGGRGQDAALLRVVVTTGVRRCKELTCPLCFEDLTLEQTTCTHTAETLGFSVVAEGISLPSGQVEGCCSLNPVMGPV